MPNTMDRYVCAIQVDQCQENIFGCAIFRSKMAWIEQKLCWKSSVDWRCEWLWYALARNREASRQYVWQMQVWIGKPRKVRMKNRINQWKGHTFNYTAMTKQVQTKTKRGKINKNNSNSNWMGFNDLLLLLFPHFIHLIHRTPFSYWNEPC